MIVKINSRINIWKRQDSKEKRQDASHLNWAKKIEIAQQKCKASVKMTRVIALDEWLFCFQIARSFFSSNTWIFFSKLPRFCLQYYTRNRVTVFLSGEYWISLCGTCTHLLSGYARFTSTVPPINNSCFHDVYLQLHCWWVIFRQHFPG